MRKDRFYTGEILQESLFIGLLPDKDLPREVPEWSQPLRVFRRRVALFEDGMKIRAAESHGADAGSQGEAGIRTEPRPRLGVHVQGGVFPCDLRIGPFHARRRGKHPVIECQGRLDGTGDAGGALGVADHGLDRSHRAGSGPDVTLPHQEVEPL